MKIFINKDKHLGDLWATLSYCVVNDAEIVIDDKCDKDRINFIKNLLYNFYNSENIKVEVGKKEAKEYIDMLSEYEVKNITTQIK